MPTRLSLPHLQVPAQRVRVLDEVMGDLTDYGVDVLYILTPGHSPGHTLYKHAPSDTVLAGDAVWLVKPQLALAPVGGLHDNRVSLRAVAGRQGGRGVLSTLSFLASARLLGFLLTLAVSGWLWLAGGLHLQAVCSPAGGHAACYPCHHHQGSQVIVGTTINAPPHFMLHIPAAATV
jgi:hypothetical protein